MSESATGIKTALTIIDGFTPTLNNLNSSLDLVTKSMIKAQAELGKDYDLSAFTSAKAEIDKLTAALDKVKKNHQTYDDSVDKTTSHVGKLAGMVKGAVAAYATFEGVKGLMNLSDKNAEQNARLNLITDGDQESVKAAKDMAYNLAQNTASSYTETLDIASKLGMNAGDMFKGEDGKVDMSQALQMTDLLQKQFSIAGATSEEMSNALFQLTQGLGSGVLQAEELNSVMDAAPIIVQNIADYMGVTTKEVKELGSQGKLTADVFKKAMFASADSINKKYAAMPMKFADHLQIIKNAAMYAFDPIFESISKISNSQLMKSFTNGIVSVIFYLATAIQNVIKYVDFFATAIGAAISGVLDSLDIVGTASQGVSSIMDGFNWVIEKVTNNFALIEPVLYGAAAALAAYGAYLLIVNARTIALAAWTKILAGAKATLAAVTTVLKGGFAALNAVMAMNPIMLVVYAVIALVTIFYVAVAAVNKFTGSTYSATGLIAGFFYGLYATIMNIVANIANRFISFAEFLINVFKNPIYSINALYVNLASNFIDGVIAMIGGWDEFATSMANAFLDAVNFVIKGWNKLMDLLPDDVSKVLGMSKATEFTARTSITSDLSESKKALQEMLGEKPDDYVTLGKFEYKDVSEYANKGYDAGANFAEKYDVTKMISDAFAAADAVKDSSDESKNKDPKAQSALDKIANNTGKMADSMSASDDELAYLREIGERNAVYRLNTNEIKVSMNNNNNINSALDLDTIMDALTNKVRESMRFAAEGNHA